MRGEFELIARYFAPLAEAAPGAQGLLNDAAVFDPSRDDSLVLTLDTMVEGVHFLPDDPPGLIGRKLLRVNLSDLAAMGARPIGYLLAGAFPKDVDEAWIAAFAAGLAVDQEVYVSGTIGDGVLGLDALRGGLRALDEDQRAALAARYRLPEPRLALGRELAETGLATAALDVSDGLVADLGHIAAASAVAAEIEADAVPLSAAARAALASDAALLPALLTGGDDYELLFTVRPRRISELADLAGRLDLPLTRIGRIGDGQGVRALDAAGQEMDLPSGGWSHF